MNGDGAMRWRESVPIALQVLAMSLIVIAHGTLRASVLIDDFEREVLDWECKDSMRRNGANLCAIWLVSPGCPHSPGKGAALITFFAAKDSWASVSKRIDGDKLRKESTEGISLWFRGDGSSASVTISLVVKRFGPTISRYNFQLPSTFRMWQRVEIPFNEFQGEDGSIRANDVGNIIAIEFRMDGTWDSGFIFIDDIWAYSRRRVSEVKLGELQPTEAKLAHIFIDPLNIVGKVRARVGTNLDGDSLGILNYNEAIERVRQLQLGIGRIKTIDLIAWSETANEARLSYDTLEQLIKLAKALRMKPMLAIIPISPQQLDSDEFIGLTTEIVRRYGFREDVSAIEFNYCHAYTLSGTPQRMFERMNQIVKAALKVRPRCAIGGVGLLAPWYDLTVLLVRSIQPLDFFSFHFFGTHNASTTTESLMKAAFKGTAADLPNQVPLNLLSSLIKQGWSDVAGLYISEANLNSIRTDDGTARDGRIHRPEGMAWWLAFLQTASPNIDEVIQFKLCGDGWGLLSDEFLPTPQYWAVWMFNTFSPKGSEMCKLTSDDPGIACHGVRTQTAVNVLVANVTDKPRRIEVRISQPFITKVSMVRLRRIMPSGEGISQPTYEVLPLKENAQFLLPGYAISVLQFVLTK